MGDSMIDYGSMSKAQLVGIISSEAARRHRMEEHIQRLTNCLKYSNPRDHWGYEQIVGSAESISALMKDNADPVVRGKAEGVLAKLHASLY